MTLRTKRDVLEELVECYAEVSDAYTYETGSPYYRDDELNYLEEYDKALPDDLPVLPKSVGEYLKDKKENNEPIGKIFWQLGCICAGLLDTVEMYIIDHTEEFACAWILDAWEVQETGEIVRLEETK